MTTTFSTAIEKYKLSVQYSQPFEHGPSLSFQPHLPPTSLTIQSLQTTCHSGSPMCTFASLCFLAVLVNSALMTFPVSTWEVLLIPPGSKTPLSEPVPWAEGIPTPLRFQITLALSVSENLPRSITVRGNLPTPLRQSSSGREPSPSHLCIPSCEHNI